MSSVRTVSSTSVEGREVELVAQRLDELQALFGVEGFDDVA